MLLPHPVHQHNPPDLSHLIGLGVAPITLQVYSFAHAFLPENMMASPYSLNES
jgi:hypothetical protein